MRCKIDNWRFDEGTICPNCGCDNAGADSKFKGGEVKPLKKELKTPPKEVEVQLEDAKEVEVS